MGMRIEGALERISCVPVRRTLRRQLETRTIQDQEAALLAEILESLSAPGAQHTGGGCPPSIAACGSPIPPPWPRW